MIPRTWSTYSCRCQQYWFKGLEIATVDRKSAVDRPSAEGISRNDDEADKNKKEMDEFRKGIKEEITASCDAIKLANASAAEKMKKNQEDFMSNIKDVIEQGAGY